MHRESRGAHYVAYLVAVVQEHEYLGNFPSQRFMISAVSMIQRELHQLGATVCLRDKRWPMNGWILRDEAASFIDPTICRRV